MPLSAMSRGSPARSLQSPRIRQAQSTPPCSASSPPTPRLQSKPQPWSLQSPQHASCARSRSRSSPCSALQQTQRPSRRAGSSRGTPRPTRGGPLAPSRKPCARALRRHGQTRGPISTKTTWMSRSRSQTRPSSRSWPCRAPRRATTMTTPRTPRVRTTTTTTTTITRSSSSRPRVHQCRQREKDTSRPRQEATISFRSRHRNTKTMHMRMRSVLHPSCRRRIRRSPCLQQPPPAMAVLHAKLPHRRPATRTAIISTTRRLTTITTATAMAAATTTRTTATTTTTAVAAAAAPIRSTTAARQSRSFSQQHRCPRPSPCAATRPCRRMRACPRVSASTM
eukprot:comp22465_c0_seq1/m.55421 comp22465_c0_seq1/g.55421  ORF comp22465_c0_seq1/g.55421 comp22465_c0_seq1/m.55421 type:complete len:338 (-) comp22465_c0_seq1:1835-2848(-)